MKRKKMINQKKQKHPKTEWNKQKQEQEWPTNKCDDDDDVCM